MSVIALLVGCSIAVAGGFLAAFLWAVRSGQYTDKYTPSVRMLFDDPVVPRGNVSDPEGQRDASDTVATTAGGTMVEKDLSIEFGRPHKQRHVRTRKRK